MCAGVTLTGDSVDNVVPASKQAVQKILSKLGQNSSSKSHKSLFGKVLGVEVGEGEGGGGEGGRGRRLASLTPATGSGTATGCPSRLET